MALSTWNPADNSDLVLSDGNHVASAQTSADAWRGIRSTTSQTSGKWYWEVTHITEVIAETGDWMTGIATSHQQLVGGWPGDSTDSIGWWIDNYTPRMFLLYFNNAVIATFGGGLKALDGDVLGFAYDCDTQDFWTCNITQNLGWTNIAAADFSGDPANGIGGDVGHALGAAAFIMFSGVFDGTSGIPAVARLNTSSAPIGVIPAGFTTWDGPRTYPEPVLTQADNDAAMLGLPRPDNPAG